jgi:hypothetical protein
MPLEPLVYVSYTRRQGAALVSLLDIGIRVGFQGVVSRDPLDLLSGDEMTDLLERLTLAQKAATVDA